MSEIIDRIEYLTQLHAQTYSEKMAEMFYPDLALAIFLTLDRYRFNTPETNPFKDKKPGEIEKHLKENGLKISGGSTLFFRAICTELMDLDEEPEKP